MDHVDGVPTACEFVGQSLHVNFIPAKIIWGIKGRDHAKAERPIHTAKKIALEVLGGLEKRCRGSNLEITARR